MNPEEVMQVWDAYKHEERTLLFNYPRPGFYGMVESNTYASNWRVMSRIAPVNVMWIADEVAE